MKKLFAILALTLCAFSVNAQQLKVATGSAKGTYNAMFNELVAACGNDVALVGVNSTGSMDNINQLVGNQVNAAFVQSDVLFFRARTEDLGNVKTLLALHSEQVHIVALTESKVKEGGFAGVGAKPVVFTDLSSLAGRRVAASGGSAVTAQVIRLQSEVNFQVVQMETNDQVLAAVAKGDVEAGLFVGGQPLPVIANLGPQFKLIGITPAQADRLKGVYKAARLNYSKMNASGIPTVTTDALFVTREYKTPKMIQSLSKFRSCATGKILELQETTGSHPAWQGVDPANRGKWQYMELSGK